MVDSEFFKKGIEGFVIESAGCSFCGATRSVPVRKIEPYCMVQCKVCGFVYLNPRPAQISLLEYYSDHYLPRDPADITNWNRMMEKVFSHAADRLTRDCAPGRVLDIGCGYGLFLKKMKNRGWETTGLEISQPGADHARRELNLSVHQSTLEDCTLPSSSFDAVTAFYVVEHSSNPLGFLEKIHHLLKDGGTVLLRYPHTLPLDKLLGVLCIRNNVYDMPFHLSDFSPHTIERFLVKAGFSMCRHFIGGYTLPAGFVNKVCSIISGGAAEFLHTASLGRFLLPGVSKTVTAVKTAPVAKNKDH